MEKENNNLKIKRIFKWKKNIINSNLINFIAKN